MKSSKPLWQISIATSPEAEDAVADFLAAYFSKAAAAYFNLETGVSTVSIFLDRKPDANKLKSELSAKLNHIRDCGLNLGMGRIKFARVKREDWAESWKRHFYPMTIGNRLLVKPSWSKVRPKKSQSLVVLDPGLSFGTGQHPTTSFCLEEIVRNADKNEKNNQKKSFLDIGTGSGILAIAAVKMGFGPVHAFDFDPESVRVAKENAKNNRILAKCKIYRGDILKQPNKPERKYNLVCANLISNLLIAERQKIVNRVKPEGTLVLAGILATEFDEVRSAFEKSGLRLINQRTEKEWCSGSFSFVLNN